jgi:4'-phosphopantetheinyl transferase
MGSAAKTMAVAPQCREFVFGRAIPSHEQADRVQVWTIDLKSNRDALAELRSSLTQDEIARADKFRFENGRTEFTITRGVLRILLGNFLGVPPGELQFSYSVHGKPRLEGALTNALEFNVSHSDGMAIICFALGTRLGVDIERVRLDFEHQHIAERFFSENEREQLRSLPAGEIPYAFFRCWTRKEAFIKALGEGLSHPLHRFDVELRGTAPARLLSTRPDAAEASRWNLFDIPVPSGYLAALAVEDNPRRA